MFDDSDDIKRATVLVAEDKESMAEMLRQTLEAEAYNVLLAGTGTEAIKLLLQNKVDLVLTDLKMPGKGGLDVVKAVREKSPIIPVILMTAFGTIELAVEAMRQGAYDFITKPFDTGHLLVKISQALNSRRLTTENILLKEEFSSKMGLPTILGKSPAMVAAAANVQKVASARTTVLILGESGTGKELFARAIHNLSPRRDSPFVAINCAAIPHDLLESELFGHEKGSFTGADQRRIGKFELADGGTIFLDEIGEMDLSLQSKLLRVLQEGEVERVGGKYPIRIDVRVLAASNLDLEAVVAEKLFREDLYYRLNVFPIHIPPLRERKEDVSLLVEHFVAKYAREFGCPLRDVDAEALSLLGDHHWRGNVRELENSIERAMILCDGSIIMPEHLALARRSGTETNLQSLPMDGTLEDVSKYAVRVVESERIKRALKETSGNKTRAAEVLSVSYKTLLTKIKDYKLG